MSTQGTLENVAQVARYVAAELRHEETTQQTRVAASYRQEYVDAAQHRIEALREADQHLRAALEAARRLNLPAARAQSTPQPADARADQPLSES